MPGKKWFFIAFIMLSAARSVRVFSQTKQDKREMVFTEKSWDNILAEAGKTSKYIFVDAYASWCAPCRLLKSSTFKDNDVARFFNTHFINASIDMEKGEGVRLADKWRVDTYPTLIIFDAGGNIVAEETGYVEAKDLISFAEGALNAKLNHK